MNDIVEGRIFTFAGEEMDWILAHEEQPLPAMQTSQMLKIFPDATKTVRNLLKDTRTKLAEYEEWRKELSSYFDRTFTSIPERESYERFWMRLLIDLPEEQLHKDIKRYETMLRWKEVQYTVTVNLAKNRAITDFIDFNRAGFAKCIWHQEKTASLKYYADKNLCHCFACNKSWDVIDVVQQLNQCSFKEALTHLS